MRHHIPDEWKPIVREHILRTRGKDYDTLSASDFKGTRCVRVEWPDRSFALFRYAFCLRKPQTQEVAVFTEHCGYFFFAGDGEFVQVQEWDEVSGP